MLRALLLLGAIALTQALIKWDYNGCKTHILRYGSWRRDYYNYRVTYYKNYYYNRYYATHQKNIMKALTDAKITSSSQLKAYIAQTVTMTKSISKLVAQTNEANKEIKGLKEKLAKYAVDRKNYWIATAKKYAAKAAEEIKVTEKKTAEVKAKGAKVYNQYLQVRSWAYYFGRNLVYLNNEIKYMTNYYTWWNNKHVQAEERIGDILDLTAQQWKNLMTEVEKFQGTEEFENFAKWAHSPKNGARSLRHKGWYTCDGDFAFSASQTAGCRAPIKYTEFVAKQFTDYLTKARILATGSITRNIQAQLQIYANELSGMEYRKAAIAQLAATMSFDLKGLEVKDTRYTEE